jgi:multidrug efflux pump subunit AcrB
MAIRLAAGANALETGDRVKAKMAELSKYFPPGMKVVYPYDTTPFVKISIEEVVHTLIEAVFLVFIIMFLFLQNFRATLIPTIAVPVVLLGTMGVLAAAGYSINTLTMFALVIVIGLLVDDAIVVVENVERNIALGLAPRDATYKAMDEVSGPIVAVALVLGAVFVPTAFIAGITGQFYRQFALTIAVSTFISAFNSLTLSPALAALLLKSHHEKKDWFTRAIDAVLGVRSATMGASVAMMADSRNWPDELGSRPMTATGRLHSGML